MINSANIVEKRGSESVLNSKYIITDLQDKSNSFEYDITELLTFANDLFLDDEEVNFFKYPLDIGVEKAIEAIEISEYQVERIK